MKERIKPNFKTIVINKTNFIIGIVFSILAFLLNDLNPKEKVFFVVVIMVLILVTSILKYLWDLLLYYKFCEKKYNALLVNRNELVKIKNEKEKEIQTLHILCSYNENIIDSLVKNIEFLVENNKSIKIQKILELLYLQKNNLEKVKGKMNHE